MKLFISWSGRVSHDAAMALRDWLPSVLQSIEPYVSSEDIEKGARWNTEISRELNDTDFGILCVTRDNFESAWLNFEAGALSKSVDASRVSPFLLGLRPAELVGPLSQFQATLPQLDDIVRLLKAINSASERPIDEARLVATVTKWWPELKARLQRALTHEAPHPGEQQRNTREMIEELLEITRRLQRQVVSRTADRPQVNVEAYRRYTAPEVGQLREIIDEAKVEGWRFLPTEDGIDLYLPEPPSEALRLQLERFTQYYGTTIKVLVAEEATE
jgi:hypothetical protein